MAPDLPRVGCGDPSHGDSSGRTVGIYLSICECTRAKEETPETDKTAPFLCVAFPTCRPASELLASLAFGRRFVSMFATEAIVAT